MAEEVMEAMLNDARKRLEEAANFVINVRRNYGTLPTPSEGSDELEELKEELRHLLADQARGHRQPDETKTPLYMIAQALAEALEKGGHPRSIKMGDIDKSLADHFSREPQFIKQLRVKCVHKNPPRGRKVKPAAGLAPGSVVPQVGLIDDSAPKARISGKILEIIKALTSNPSVWHITVEVSPEGTVKIDGFFGEKDKSY